MSIATDIYRAHLQAHSACDRYARLKKNYNDILDILVYHILL